MPRINQGAQALLLLCLAASHPLNAQSISVGASVTGDPNIFDAYYPVADLVSELSLGATDWNLSDNSFYGYFYSGSLAFHRETPERDYQLHMGMLGYRYHFNGGGKDDPESGDEAAHSDSLDQFLYLRLTGSANLNKAEYEQWDALTIGGTAAFRQSLGERASLRPAYAFSYLSYPNLSSITNLQHKISLTAGTDILPSNWFALLISYGVKTFPVDQTDSVSVTKTSRPKSGGGGSEKTVSYDMSTPSVSQPSVSLIWDYVPAPTTDFSFRYTHYFDPSSESRSIPDLRKGAIRNSAAAVRFSAGENELYDDPFSYAGDIFSAEVEQVLPLELSAGGSLRFERKRYTYPAASLDDSTLAENRSDARTVLGIMLSRSFELTEETALTVTLFFEHSKNSSNSDFFDFRKNAIMAGAEYSF